jgi:hypothetical protein
MSKLKFIYIIIVYLIIGLVACEDPITVELENAEDVIVVDGWINTTKDVQTIQISRSQAYFNNGTPQPIIDALVSVVRNDGRVFIFEHDGLGYYRWNTLATDSLGNVNDDFELIIETNGQQITGSATVHRVPNVDSIGVEYRTDEAFIDDGYYAQFYARDFVGAGDSYWIKTYRNDTYLDKATEINIAYDAGFDAGTGIDGLIFIPPIREQINPVDEDGIPTSYDIGDKIRVEVHSISNSAFNFMEIVRDQINNGSNGIFSFPLANARTNLAANNGSAVLGFFNVAAVRSLETTVEE